MCARSREMHAWMRAGANTLGAARIANPNELNRKAPMKTKTLSDLALLALLSACSGGGGGTGGIPLALDENETPANDTPATANTLKLGQPMRGEVLVAGDVDCFAIHLSKKQVVRIELFGTRNDQASWD